MKRGLFGILLCLSLILLFSISATAIVEVTDKIFSAKSATLDIEISSNLNVEPTSSNYVLQTVDAKIALFPRDSTHQTVSLFETTPQDYDSEDDFLVFNWKAPIEDVTPFSVRARVETNGEHIPIKRAIAFPLDINALNADIRTYIASTDNIDSDNPDIQALASELTYAKTDMYEVVYVLAKWVHANIEYNLSTLTADVSQRASWVLENRIGVCDEMTSLFIALLRSVEIPARYVTGISYTNSDLFDDEWGPHGWAEVYFPGYGWVPFDVTYEEYGHIDPSHIELRKVADSGLASSFFGWYGYDVKIVAEKMNIDPTVISISDANFVTDPDVEIVAEPYAKSVEFGSYNMVEVSIKNLRDYYLPYAVYLSNTEDVQILDPNPKLILLKPGETQRFFWRLKVTPKLNKDYIYTFPFFVYTKKNESTTISFISKDDEISYSEWEMDRISDIKTEEFSKKESENLKFACDFERRFYYVGEKQTIICQITNMADKEYTDVKLCMHEMNQNDCNTITIAPVSQQEYVLRPTNDYAGIREIPLSLSNEDVSKYGEVTQEVREYPRVTISDVKYPKDVTYGDEYQISFSVSGENEPKDLKINLKVNSLSKTWRLDQLLVDRQFVISLDSADLYPRDNEMAIKVIYDDDNDKSYHLEKEYEINLVEIPFFTNIWLNIKMFLEKTFT